MFLILKKKYLIVFLAIIMSLIGIIIFNNNANHASAYDKHITIVLDAGHGGIDGGSVGSNTNIAESELNLKYSRCLAKLLRNFGFKVIETRTTSNGLYSTIDDNFKKQDMLKRQEIIEQSDAQIVLSIHMNKFTLQSERGAQVFYNEESEEGKKLAESIRDMLVRDVDYARKLALGGDFFITKCSDIPSAIVEFGFLSNPEEELLLQQNSYMEKMCYSVFCGIINYLQVVNF